MNRKLEVEWMRERKGKIRVTNRTKPRLTVVILRLWRAITILPFTTPLLPLLPLPLHGLPLPIMLPWEVWCQDGCWGAGWRWAWGLMTKTWLACPLIPRLGRVRGPYEAPRQGSLHCLVCNNNVWVSFRDCMGHIHWQKNEVPKPQPPILQYPQMHEVGWKVVGIFFMHTIIFTTISGVSKWKNCKIPTLHKSVNSRK